MIPKVTTTARLPHITVILWLCACQQSSPRLTPTPTLSPAPIPTPISIVSPTAEPQVNCKLGPPPRERGFDPFYEQYCDAGGIPIISPNSVDPVAFEQAYDIITNMLEPIPWVHIALLNIDAYFAIIPKKTELTEMPEYSHLDSDYWDERARALGGTLWSPMTSGPEENLLCHVRDWYRNESISVHEFAHTIHLAGLFQVDPEFDGRLRRLYDQALERDLWITTYASTDHNEYWAEGVQSYFDTNVDLGIRHGNRQAVETRKELAEFDPALFALIDEVFKGHAWSPTCP